MHESREASKTGADLRLKLFCEYRDHLWKIRQSNYERADTIILTISSALLGWSPSLLSRGTEQSQATSALGWFVCAWVSLAVAIVVTLLSFFFVRRAISKQMEGAEAYYLNHDESGFDKGARWTKATEVTNVIASLSFVSGIIVLAVAVAKSMG